MPTTKPATLARDVLDTAEFVELPVAPVPEDDPVPPVAAVALVVEFNGTSCTLHFFTELSAEAANKAPPLTLTAIDEI